MGNLFQQLYNLVDTIIVGKVLGLKALTAVGATTSINFLIIGFHTDVWLYRGLLYRSGSVDPGNDCHHYDICGNIEKVRETNKEPGRITGKRMMNEIEQYYNKFNEEKRLNSRHGRVEFLVSMKYIHEYLPEDREASEIKILDIGAGTGRYSVALAEEGYDVTAVELVKYNLGILKQKKSSVKAMQGNALNLKKLQNDTFDVTLLFGPMYHLFSYEDKLKALNEAKRVTKPGGVILVAYCMNEYGVITYAFKERHIRECMEEKRLSPDFHTISAEKNLYDYVRVEDIRRLAEDAGVERLKMISPDGPANYMRPFLNRLSEEEFAWFIDYQMATCEREELLGAGAHTVDILRK